ncbi:nucleotide-binding protein [Streptomyces djakartensis]|uniref:nucleotide-binding protein n=1 Tax=Streptomyces djakartensis TaxID=68193 RepID=UPI0034DFEF58
MPSGDNWQNDVLRDLRGGTPQQRAAQPDEQQQAPAPRQPPAPQQATPQQPPAQQPASPQQAPSQQVQAPLQGTPGPHAQGRPPAYGYPHQPQQPAPAGQQHAQPPQPYAGQYAAPQQPHPGQTQPPQQHAPQHQERPAQHRQRPVQYAEQAPAPRARSSRTAPESRPVVDRKLLSAGKGPRRGESFAARAVRAVRRTLASSASREVAETTATAETLQQPVTTGRQIAVTSIRGGSGKTTVAALLATTYAHYRQDPVLVVEADPALGSLPLRLGAENLRWTTGDLADVLEPQMTLLDITGYLVQLPENAWLLPGSQGQVGAMLDTKGYERIMVSMRRYFGVTVADCETLPAEVARTALSAAQARILTVPATLEGVASTHAVLEWMRGLPRDITTSTVVVLTETAPHTGVDLDKAAEQLKATGASVCVLPYDRHLAAGGTIRTELLARGTRQAAARLAAQAFQLSHRRR